MQRSFANSTTLRARAIKEIDVICEKLIFVILSLLANLVWPAAYMNLVSHRLASYLLAVAVPTPSARLRCKTPRLRERRAQQRQKRTRRNLISIQ